MAEIVDTFVALDERVPAPEGNPAEDTERTWGQATEDVAGNVLATIANGGKPLQIIASGLEAGLNTEQFQERKAARARAARMADLQLRQAEANAIAQEQKNSQSAQLFPGQKRLQEQTIESNDIALDQARINQQRAWENEGKRRSDLFTEKLKEQFGYNNLNLFGQSIMDNSENLKALTQAMQIYEAYQRSDEEGDYMLRQSGWSRKTLEDGKTFFVSPDGKQQFDVNPESLKKMMTDIQMKLKDDIAASYILGGDSTDLQQYALKNILNQPGTEQIFGTPGNALSMYNNFIKTGITDANGKILRPFTKEEKLGHLLSRSLQSAIVDGKISQEEMAQLTPLFAMTVKKLGGEVIFGEDVATSKIKLANGMEVPLVKFASDIAQRDIVMSSWQNYTNNLQKQMVLDQARLERIRSLTNKTNNSIGKNGTSNTGTEQDTKVQVDVYDGQYNADQASMYGTNWYDLSPEQKKDFEQKKDEILAEAKTFNLTKEIDKKIEPLLPEEIRPEQIKHLDKLIKKENALLDDLDLPEDTGYWYKTKYEAIRLHKEQEAEELKQDFFSSLLDRTNEQANEPRDKWRDKRRAVPAGQVKKWFDLLESGKWKHQDLYYLLHPVRTEGYIPDYNLSDEEKEKRTAAWMEKHGYKNWWDIPFNKDKSDLELRGDGRIFFDNEFIPFYQKYHKLKEEAAEAQEKLNASNGNN